jgi:lipopolysaccharide biosynthesis glycosyltransferase
MSAIELACASDERYLAHSAALLHSALVHRGNRELRIHYLCSPKVPQRLLDALEGMVVGAGGSLRIHRIPDEWVAGMPTWNYIGSSMWYRFFLPDLVPDAERVLYVDADTIVADSLEPLWTIDLGAYYLGAVTNVFEQHQLHRAKKLGLDSPEDYFNSGVLLLNLEQMRKDGSTEALAAFARENSADLLWPDQDTLNVVLGRRRLKLHPRWNAMNSVLGFPSAAEIFGATAVEEARFNPGIRHFEGPAENKPWHYLSDEASRSLYLEHRRQTPWPKLKVEGRSPANLIRRWRERSTLRP